MIINVKVRSFDEIVYRFELLSENFIFNGCVKNHEIIVLYIILIGEKENINIFMR